MSDRHDLILVTGATGKQGGATARHLLAAGVPVRALVRDTEAPAARQLAALGAQLVEGDFDEPATVSAAVTGARAVFGVPPAAFGDGGWDDDLEARRGIVLVEAARAAGVEQFVFTGVATFRHDGNGIVAGKRRIEEAIAGSGLRYTLLRPARFMENYLAHNVATVPGYRIDRIEKGVHWHLFPAEHPVQVIAVDDIGAFAALVFADPARFHGQSFEMAGDELSLADAAATIGRATGFPLRYEEIGEQEAAALGEEIHTVWRLAHEGEGWHADIPAIRKILPGLHTFDAWLAETGAERLAPLLAR